MTRRAAGEGTLYFNENKGLWIGELNAGSIDGRRLRRKVSGHSKKEAADKLKKLREEISSGVDWTGARVPLGQFVDRWLTDVVSTRCKPRTVESYRGLLTNHVLPDLGDVRLDKVTAPQIQRVLKSKLDAGLSGTTVERVRDVLRNALNQAVQWNLLAKNPVNQTSAPHVQQYRPKFWRVEQMQHFFSVIREDAPYPLFVLAATTALRQGELLGLRWQDVDLKEARLSVTGSLQRVRGVGLVRSTPKTERSARTLALSRMAIDALQERRERQELERAFAGAKWKDSDFVFTSLVGTPMDPRGLGRDFKVLAAKAELPEQRFHDFRHFNATIQLNGGASVKAVQESLGHSTASTTLEIYAHVLQETHQSMADRMDALFAAPTGEKSGRTKRARRRQVEKRPPNGPPPPKRRRLTK